MPLRRGRPCSCRAPENPRSVQGGGGRVLSTDGREVRPGYRPRASRGTVGGCPHPTWPPPSPDMAAAASVPAPPPCAVAVAVAMQRAARPLLWALLRAAPPWRPRRPPPAPPPRCPPTRRPLCTAAASGQPQAAHYRLVYTCKVGAGGRWRGGGGGPRRRRAEGNGASQRQGPCADGPPPGSGPCAR